MAQKSNSQSFWQRLQNILITPYVLGILITVIAAHTAIIYFTEKDSARKSHSVAFKFLNWVHQKSLDFQFHLRGPRPVSDDIALITVDEKAIQQEGRWPWPRMKIKQIIENVMKYGAKVVGFDTVFSEEDTNLAVHLLNDLKSNPKVPASVHPIIDAQIAQANTDLELAETIKTFAPNLVLGVFSNDKSDVDQTYQTPCTNLFMEDSPDVKNWDKVQVPVVADVNVEGIFEDEPPEAWTHLLLEHKTRLEAQTTAQFLKALNLTDVNQLNKTQKLELRNQINEELRAYCDQRFLKPNDELLPQFEQTWPEIAKIVAKSVDQPEFNFKEGLEYLKNSYLKHPLELVYDFVFNYPAITENLHHMAYFNAHLDNDGIMRQIPLVKRVGRLLVPALSLKTFLVAMKYNINVNFKKDTTFTPPLKYVSSVQIRDEEAHVVGEIPVNKKGEFLINYAGPQKMFPHISVADILNDSQDLTYQKNEFDPTSQSWTLKTYKASKQEFLKDKILLLGATAIGIYDLRVIPFDENFPGLEIHANIIDNLLENNFYVEKVAEAEVVIWVIGLGVFFTILFSYLGAFWGFFWATMSIVGYIFYDKYFLFAKGQVFPVFFPILLLSVLYLAITIFKYFTEERHKKMLRNTFQKYVSPAIVNEILSDPSKIELGGRKQKMTVFFSDVRGFTTISEKLDPQALSDLLNNYLTPMTEIVFKNQGTLDKYMGDAIMAFFGAPISYENHAVWACRCALEQLKKLKEFQADCRKLGLPEIDIGIGLNTGEMSVGNMGSQTIRNYTVMGDAVNLGSRLEGINKQYGTRIIISEFTQAELHGQFTTRELDWVKVKGKNKPVKIFELICEGHPTGEMEQVLKNFNLGYEMYHKMQWAKAIEFFNKALEIKPDDGPSKIYLERCLQYQSDPPPPDWDGVFVMKTK